MVYGLQGMMYPDKCKELRLETLEERRDRLDMALVHKLLTENTGTGLFQRTASQQRARTRQAAGEHDSVCSLQERTLEGIHSQ